MNMVRVLIALVLALQCRAASTKRSFDISSWPSGPLRAPLKDVATLKVPEGYVFAGPEVARGFMRSIGNVPSPRLVGVAAGNDARWFVIFEYAPIGHVRDDDGVALDSGIMMEALKNLNESQNEQRARKSLPRIELAGWQIKPYYDSLSHTLEYAVKVRSQGLSVVNYTIRLLGRRGVMEVSLVGVGEASAHLPELTDLLKGFSFVEGERYEEFQAGDPIAPGGLNGMIAAAHPKADADAEGDAGVPSTTAPAKMSEQERAASFPVDAPVLIILGSAAVAIILALLAAVWLAQRRARLLLAGAIGAGADPTKLNETLDNRTRLELASRTERELRRLDALRIQHRTFFNMRTKNAVERPGLETKVLKVDEREPGSTLAERDYRLIETVVHSVMACSRFAPMTIVSMGIPNLNFQHSRPLDPTAEESSAQSSDGEKAGMPKRVPPPVSFSFPCSLPVSSSR